MRNPFFDSLKGVLIILVVFGHFLAYGLSSRLCLATYNFVYMFHMPLFIVISGYFSNPSSKRYWRRTLGLLETYFVFQLLFLLLNQVPFSIHSLLVPQFGLWYLLSLFYWRIILALSPPLKKYGVYNPKVLLFFAFLIGLIGGVLPVSRFMSIQRTFYFFPFFMAGFCARNSRILTALNKNVFGWVSIGVIALVFCSPCILNSRLYLRFLGCDPYDVLWEGMKTRLVNYIISFTLSASIVCAFRILLPTKKHVSFLIQAGTGSLVIYLFHLFLLPVVPILPHYLLLYLLSALFVVGALSFISKYPFVRFFLNPISSYLSSRSSKGE